MAAERDVLMAGLLLHRLLAGHPALDDPDLASASLRVGPEIVRLPWSTPQPVAETLRSRKGGPGNGSCPDPAPPPTSPGASARPLWARA